MANVLQQPEAGPGNAFKTKTPAPGDQRRAMTRTSKAVAQPATRKHTLAENIESRPRAALEAALAQIEAQISIRSVRCDSGSTAPRGNFPLVFALGLAVKQQRICLVHRRHSTRAIFT